MVTGIDRGLLALVLWMGLAASACAAGPTPEGPVDTPAQAPLQRGPSSTPPAAQPPARSPLNSRDQVWQTQPPRPGYYQDIPRRHGEYPHGPGMAPPAGSAWQGRPGGRGDGWGPGPRHQPGQRVDGFPGQYWKRPYGGQDYFYSGGYWYRPYGDAYVVVRPPYGVRVDGLPAYAQALWLNGQPLYQVADTYYRYLPDAGQYMVVDPGAAPPDAMPGPGAVISVQPLRGQDPQQQAQDQDDCHRWAVGQSGFDPANAPYAPAPSVLQAYQQTLGACLQERGYGLQWVDR